MEIDILGQSCDVVKFGNLLNTAVTHFLLSVLISSDSVRFLLAFLVKILKHVKQGSPPLLHAKRNILFWLDVGMANVLGAIKNLCWLSVLWQKKRAIHWRLNMSPVEDFVDWYDINWTDCFVKSKTVFIHKTLILMTLEGLFDHLIQFVPANSLHLFFVEVFIGTPSCACLLIFFNFQKLSQIIADLFRENLTEREAEITSFPFDTDGEWQCARIGHRVWRAEKFVFFSVLSLMKTVTPWKTKRNQEESFCECWGSIFQVRVEGWPEASPVRKYLAVYSKSSCQHPLDHGSNRIWWTHCYEERFCTWSWWKSVWRLLVCGKFGLSVFCSTYVNMWLKEVLFLSTLPKVGWSLSPKTWTSMTMEGLLDHQMHIACWLCTTVIANFSFMLSVEAFIGTPWGAFTPHRDASHLGKWRTTSWRLRPLLWPMLRVIRKNHVYFWLILLLLIPVSIIPGSSLWLRTLVYLPFLSLCVKYLEGQHHTRGICGSRTRTILDGLRSATMLSFEWLSFCNDFWPDPPMVPRVCKPNEPGQFGFFAACSVRLRWPRSCIFLFSRTLDCNGTRFPLCRLHSWPQLEQS